MSVANAGAVVQNEPDLLIMYHEEYVNRRCGYMSNTEHNRKKDMNKVTWWLNIQIERERERVMPAMLTLSRSAGLKTFVLSRADMSRYVGVCQCVIVCRSFSSYSHDLFSHS